MQVLTEPFSETGIVIGPYRLVISHCLSNIQPASGPSLRVVSEFIDNFIESLQSFLGISLGKLEVAHIPSIIMRSVSTPLSRIDFAAWYSSLK